MAPVSERLPRVGLLVPSSNTTMEIDLARALESRATVHVSRMYLADCDAAGENRMLDEHLLPAIRDIATVHPDVVVFGCTSAGALRGNEFDAQLCQDIGDSTSAVPVSTLQAAQDALSATGAHRVGLVTPYPEELTERISASLAEVGFEVPKCGSMGYRENFAIASIGRSEIIGFAKQAMTGAEIDAVFISCTNLAAMQAIPSITEALGVPVVTSNHAVVEAVSKALHARVAV